MIIPTKTPPCTTLLSLIIQKLNRGSSPDSKWPDGNGVYWPLCPYHADKKSGSFSVGEKGFKCFSCGEKGSLTKLAKKLGVATAAPSPAQSQGLTVDEYCAEKHLDIDFLRGLGVTDRAQDGVKVLKIPYNNSQGQEIATRYRTGHSPHKRFWWAKGSRLIPYGLWKLDALLQCCTVSSGGTPYVILVEGESDAQTLWSYGVPALGIPGASTWKQDWVEYIKGFQVYIWREPDAGGNQFVARICQDLPDALIITPPTGRKDISECHILGEDIPNLVQSLRANAMPYKSVQNGNQASEAQAAYLIAKNLLHADILSEFEKLMTELGLVDETENAKVIYLAVTSRLLNNPVSVVVKGPSSGGKSFSVEMVLKTFPENAYYALSGMSEHALAYSQEPLAHRMLVIYEVVGLNSEFASYLLRSLLSEGRVRYETVEKTDKGLEARVIVREGPTGVILTTTWAGLHPENETRMLSIDIRDDKSQTRAIILKQGFKAKGESSPPPDLKKWHALQAWLSLGGDTEVVIPFADILAQHTSEASVRMRRDFPKVLSLISATALLYQCQRDRDTQGRVIATIEDYENVYKLVNDCISESLALSTRQETQETVKAVAELLQSNKPRVTSISESSLAETLNLDKSSVSRRVKVAIREGYLENLEDRKGKRAKIVLGEPLPTKDISALPHPDDLRKILSEHPPVSDATVQHPFIPSAEWQEIPDDFPAPPGAVFRMNFTLGKNFARWPDLSQTGDPGQSPSSEGVDTNQSAQPLSLEDLISAAPYPDTNKSCPVCGGTNWKLHQDGETYYCGTCHP